MKFPIIFILLKLFISLSTERKLKINSLISNFTVFIYVDDHKYSGSFQSNDILNKSTEDQKRGWIFTMKDTVDGDLAKVMHKIDSGSNYYLPFISTPLDFTFVNPVGQGKWIENTIMVSRNESHKVMVQFEYKYLGAVIHNDKLRELVNALNSKKVERQNFIKSLKNETNAFASTYHTNKQSYEAVSKGVDGINEQIKTYNKRLLALDTKLKRNNKTMSTIMRNITEEEIKASNLKNEQNIIINDMNTANNLIDETNKI